MFQIREVTKSLKAFGYKKINAKYGVAVFVKESEKAFSQAVLVHSPNPKSKMPEFEVGVIHVPLANLIIDIEEAQFIGLYFINYGWSVTKWLQRNNIPYSVENYVTQSIHLSELITEQFDAVVKEALSAIKGFRQNRFFEQDFKRKYGSFEAYHGLALSIMKEGYLDPAIQQKAFNSVAADPAEYKQLEFKLGLIQRYLERTTSKGANLSLCP
ncbi:hypothetical protein [Rheinheimera sp. 1928-s]|uniref:hypothetical protein n=1 Tax=Rheinheimera sp. 1928-s TaxID=3033803 RepID=UPI00261C4B1F|nr:hypothetical protein [Rheinheimera sp. 1928-s]MDF3125202.1 hypothetical protein [Rheinheimera sp. 1928-s]